MRFDPDDVWRSSAKSGEDASRLPRKVENPEPREFDLTVIIYAIY